MFYNFSIRISMFCLLFLFVSATSNTVQANFAPTTLKVCKIAGPGVPIGTPFTFDIAVAPAFTTSVTVNAGTAAMGGNCVFVNGDGLPGGAFETGSTVTITERTGFVTAITSATSPTVAAGTAGGGLFVNLGARQATLFGAAGLVAGVNIVTFINAPSCSISASNNMNGDFDGDGKPETTCVRYQKFDFDGDGRADVGVFRPSNGVWYIQRSKDGFIGVQFGQSGDKIVPADYDGDYKTDIAVFRPSEGIWYILRSKDGFIAIPFGTAEDIPQPADYNGDRRAEIAVFRPSNGTWYIYNLANNQFTGFQFGQVGDVPVAEDYDGDGKTDIAVFRNGIWYIQRSQLGFTAIAFGQTGDKPIPADFDGDGKADVAVLRNNGVFYVMGSTGGFTGVQFALGTDTPMAADYDGDGKADLALFRPSNGGWYILRSKDGLYSVQFGAPGDIPIPSAFLP